MWGKYEGFDLDFPYCGAKPSFPPATNTGLDNLHVVGTNLLEYMCEVKQYS